MLSRGRRQSGDLVNVTIHPTDVRDYMTNGRMIGRIWRDMAES